MQIIPSVSLIATALLSGVQLASAHFEITYPAWRGNTLRDEMQWQYPCGGLGVSQNRTKWPLNGSGKISVLPGWNAGHPTAFFYINMGFDTNPVNHSHPMKPIFQITGPSRDPYPGSFCIQDVPLPVNASVRVGDNATIQVIQVATHGASLYNCADITFVDAKDADPVPPGACQNSSTIGFNAVYTTRSRSAGVSSITAPSTLLSVAAIWATILAFSSI